MLGKTFHLVVNTPTGILFEDDIIQAEICSSKGYYVLLVNHAPIIGAMRTSVLYFRDQNNNRIQTIVNEGAFHFNENVLNIFTDFFCFNNQDKVNVLKIRQEQIQKVLKSKYANEKEHEHITSKLKENILQLKKFAKI